MQASPNSTSPRKFSARHLSLWKTGLILIIVEGILALFYSLMRSSQEDASPWGYSTSQLAVSSLILLGLAGGIFATILLIKKTRFEEWVERAEYFLIQQKNLPPFSFGLAMMGFVAILPIPLTGWLENDLDSSSIIFVLLKRITPLLMWIAAAAFHTLGLWVLLYHRNFLAKEMWNLPILLQVGTIALIFLLTLIHWIILVVQIPILTSIPGWYWGLTPAAFSWRDLLFLPALMILLCVVYFLFRTPGAAGKKILLFFFFAVLLQVGFGLAEGKGYEAIRHKFSDSLHRSYVAVVCTDQIDIPGIIREYNQRYGVAKVFMRTKPPGVLVLYKAIQNMLGISPQSEGCFDQITTFISYTFPWIAGILVGWVFLYYKKFNDLHQVWLALLFILTAPNFVLIPLFLDQVLYPSLFLASCILIFWVVERHSILFGLIGGMVLYLMIFISFSMLPLLPLAVIALILDFWLKPLRSRIARSFAILAAMIAGFFILSIGFAVLLQYDIFVRFQASMQQVNYDDYYLKIGAVDQYGQVVPWIKRASQVSQALVANNLELSTSVGIPLYVLFLFGSVGVIDRVRRRKVKKGDFELGSLLVTFIAMNLYGQTRGEVARLWIFWVPMLAFLASRGLLHIFDQKRWIIYLLLILQFITTVLIFKFQGFKV